MIFVLQEDSTLDVFASTADACRRCEGIDVEDGAYKFYDNNGTLLVPRFTKPNVRTRFLGIAIVISGRFELMPSVGSSDKNLLTQFGQISELRKNSSFRDLEEVRRHLTSQRDVPNST